MKLYKRSYTGSALTGAAFLMATSAIGPGFLTQTTVFTQQLKGDFALIILTTILLDIIVQLNIWRILTVTNKRAQQLANEIFPGLGHFLSLLVFTGGIVFNIGNIAGCVLGIQILTGLNNATAAGISAGIAVMIFFFKKAAGIMDNFTKLLGVVMILLTVYVATQSQPHLHDVISGLTRFKNFNTAAAITLIGGTVGGYISFAGAHRLLDAGIHGEQQLRQVNKSAVSGIVITGIMRSILFLAAFGVVATGFQLAADNPPADVFRIAAGNAGYYFFGVVMWSASITSVIGASYTSVSFVQTMHSSFHAHKEKLIVAVIILSALIFIITGKPVQLLVAAGAVNGIILPLALAIILYAATNKKIIGKYRHPIWLQALGWVVVIVMSWLSIQTLANWL